MKKNDKEIEGASQTAKEKKEIALRNANNYAGWTFMDEEKRFNHCTKKYRNGLTYGASHISCTEAYLFIVESNECVVRSEVLDCVSDEILIVFSTTSHKYVELAKRLSENCFNNYAQRIEKEGYKLRTVVIVKDLDEDKGIFWTADNIALMYSGGEFCEIDEQTFIRRGNIHCGVNEWGKFASFRLYKEGEREAIEVILQCSGSDDKKKLQIQYKSLSEEYNDAVDVFADRFREIECYDGKYNGFPIAVTALKCNYKNSSLRYVC